MVGRDKVTGILLCDWPSNLNLYMYSRLKGMFRKHFCDVFFEIIQILVYSPYHLSSTLNIPWQDFLKCLTFNFQTKANLLALKKDRHFSAILYSKYVLCIHFAKNWFNLQ